MWPCEELETHPGCTQDSWDRLQPPPSMAPKGQSGGRWMDQWMDACMNVDTMLWKCVSSVFHLWRWNWLKPGLSRSPSGSQCYCTWSHICMASYFNLEVCVHLLYTVHVWDSSVWDFPGLWRDWSSQVTGFKPMTWCQFTGDRPVGAVQGPNSKLSPQHCAGTCLYPDQKNRNNMFKWPPFSVQWFWMVS